MMHVHSSAWYLQWYVLAGIAFVLYALSYGWYLALGATTPVGWVKQKLRKRRQARVLLQQQADLAARKAKQAAVLAERERQKAARHTGITIDAEPDSIDRTSAT